MVTPVPASAGLETRPPAAVAVVGVGPENQFSIARGMTFSSMTWEGTFGSLAALQESSQPAPPYVVLLDGDVLAEELIGILDQHAPLLSRNSLILLVTKPPVRLAVTAMQRGVLDVLLKPVTTQRLGAALKDAAIQCERRRLEQRIA